MGGADKTDSFARPSKQSLRAWLHLIKCSKRVEQTISDLFRTRYNSSLSRFDVLAQLEHSGSEGITTSALAQGLLASKGNITRLLDRMISDGLIERRPSSEDRRVSYVFLTAKGAEAFHRMAEDHEVWSEEIFGVLSATELEQLVSLLDRVRRQVDDQARKR
ncbi:MAG TPA: MarR family transcriptional regulator [Gammaproteobacteria bacterium]|jgi:DNA-binding MarR family transcriptional regulator|nr:MarR family transcriptional regulator [Gammaproteobacteria bacterium]